MHLFSPSQVSLWNECQRKWAWRYIAKIKIPQHLKAALGDEVEKAQLIPYLVDARPFNFGAVSGSGYIAASSLAYLPKPQTLGMVLQKHFVIPSPTWVDVIGPEGRSRKHAGFGFQGYMDMYLPDAALAPDEGDSSGLPYICDFKTKSTFKYALTTTQLRTDTAANMYAFAVMYETKQKQIRLSWLNMLSEGPRQCKRVNLTLTADSVAAQFQKDNATAIDMYSVVQAAQAVPETDRASFPLILPPSPNQCRAFGGCPHQHRCNLSPVEQVQAFIAESAKAIFGSTPTEENMTPATNPFLAKLQAKKAGATPAAASAAVPTAPVIPPYAEQVAITAAKDAAAQAASAPPTNTPAGTTPLPAWALEKTPYQGHALTEIVGLNPPESALPPAPPISATKKRGPGRPPKAAAAAPEGTIGTPATAAPTPAPEDPAKLLLATTPATQAVSPSVAPPGHIAGDSAILHMAKAYDLIAQGFSELAKATRAVVVGK